MPDKNRLDDVRRTATRPGRAADVHSIRRISDGWRTRLTAVPRIARDRIASRLATLRSPATRQRIYEQLGIVDRSRSAAVVAVLCGLGLVAFVDAQGRPVDLADTSRPAPAAEVAAPASPRPGSVAPVTDPDLRPPAAPGESGSEAPAPSAEAPAASAEAPHPRPSASTGTVAGLSPVQMDNAKAIVRTGRDMGMPRRALIIGVATAMQESNLLNRASEVVPESKRYPHQGTGWDHDSVGLFQQRTSSGWGPVAKLMDPAYASQRFFSALEQVPGWERMRLTDAAQAVQVSAFPEHYAKHESAATEVVDAILPTLQ